MEFIAPFSAKGASLPPGGRWLKICLWAYFESEDDMDQIAEAIAAVIKGGEEKVPYAREIVDKLTAKYPLI